MPAAKVYALASSRLLPLAGGSVVIPPSAEGPGGGGGGSEGNRNTMLVGAASASLSGSDFAALDAVAGPWTVRRSYDNDSTSIPTSWADSNAGIDVGVRASVWSGKPPVLAMASGALDAQVTSFISSIPDSQIAFVTIWHEADAKVRQKQKDSAGTTITVANYITAFQRFASLVHAVGKPHVYVAQILTVWSGIAAPAGTTFVDTWPGDGYVDVFAVDGYSDVGSGSALWGPAVAFATSKDIPWGIGEAGCSGTASATWMQNQADYAASTAAGGGRSQCAFLCWFSNGTGGVIPTPGTDPTLQATSREIAQSFFTDVNAYIL